MRAVLPTAVVLMLGAILAGCTSTWDRVFWFAKKPQPAASPVLSPGLPAQEIASADVDGAPFKLSDYRGKVVMLDFWGNW
jgi:hypothetical protein